MAPNDISWLGCKFNWNMFVSNNVFTFWLIEREKVAHKASPTIHTVIYEIIREWGIEGYDCTPSKFFNFRHFIGLKSLNLISSYVWFEQLDILLIGIFEFFGIFDHDDFFNAHVIREL